MTAIGIQPPNPLGILSGQTAPGVEKNKPKKIPFPNLGCSELTFYPLHYRVVVLQSLTVDRDITPLFPDVVATLDREKNAESRPLQVDEPIKIVAKKIYTFFFLPKDPSERLIADQAVIDVDANNISGKSTSPLFWIGSTVIVDFESNSSRMTPLLTRTSYPPRMYPRFNKDPNSSYSFAYLIFAAGTNEAKPDLNNAVLFQCITPNQELLSPPTWDAEKAISAMNVFFLRTRAEHLYERLLSSSEEPDSEEDGSDEAPAPAAMASTAAAACAATAPAKPKAKK